MKNNKKTARPNEVPQMTLFEGEPETPAPLAAPEPSPAVQPPSPPTGPERSATAKPKTPAPAAASKKPAANPTATAKRSSLPLPAAASPPPLSRGRTSSAVPEGDVRLTANIREDLHLKLKIAAARQRTTIGELIEQWVENLL